MGRMKTLFDDVSSDDNPGETRSSRSSQQEKEAFPLDRLKNLEEKITTAVERVKALKDEKILLERKIRELENILNEKNEEIESLRSEKTSIKNQVEELLTELETLEN